MFHTDDVFHTQNTSGTAGRLNNSITPYASTVYKRNFSAVECPYNVSEQVSQVRFLATNDRRPAFKRNAGM